MKRCPICKVKKALRHFYRCLGYYSSYCKKCQNAVVRPRSRQTNKRVSTNLLYPVS